MENVYWNIFARELQFILQGRGLKLGDLTLHTGVHPQKVQRLLQSLHTPAYGLPTLGTEEVKRVSDVLSLDEDERIRLRAALLTIFVQRTLYQHIPSQDVQIAADQIFPTILIGLAEQVEKEKVTGNIRGGDFGGYEDTELDKALAVALEAIDSGVEDLQMCENINSRSKKAKLLLHARASFKEAINALRRLSPGIQWQLGWQYWHDEAQKELAYIDRLLEELSEG